jgi:hypothetical protein
MKVPLLLLLIFHGLIHLMGFLKEWNLAPVPQLSGSTVVPLSRNAAHITGTFWLAACLLCLITAAVLLFKKDGWWIPALLAVLLSQTLIILYWKDARFGTIANVILFAAAIVGYANWQFTNTVKKEVTRIFAAVPAQEAEVVTADMLHGLPTPVQNWINHSGLIGEEFIHTVRLKQQGWMHTKPGQEKWVSAEAEQYITIDNPAFVWKANMNLIPMVPVTGRDKFINGRGQMNVKLLGLFNVVKEADAKIDQGALQRYLAEIGLYPSAALSPIIKWEAIDATTAKATMTYNGVAGTVTFHFNPQGDITLLTADRYSGGGNDAKLEKWEVRTIASGVYNGVRIPVKSEVSWKLQNGDFTWYKLEITEIEYNLPQLYLE